MDKTHVWISTFTGMPALVHRAVEETGSPSMAAYMREAICVALARDLDIPYEDLIAQLPPTRRYFAGRIAEEVR